MRPSARTLVALSLALAVSACGASSDDFEAGPDGGNGKSDGTTEEPGDEADAAPVEPELPPDLCLEAPVSCPVPSGLSEGGGMKAIESCAFPLESKNRYDETETILDALAQKIPEVTIGEVLSDLNRTGASRSSVPGNPAGLQKAFVWQSGDESVDYWIPQGITTSMNSGYTADGRVEGIQVGLVSWYYNKANDEGSTQEKGVRIAVTDLSSGTPTYRFILLVEPAMVDGKPSYKPVRVHAGGLAWVNNYLYVVHTGVGFRVFDLDRLLKVSTGKDVIGYDAADDAYYAHNYAYVLPQVETVAQVGECAPRFSWVSLDRSGEVPVLLTGEYNAEAITGRVYRWPLDPETGRMAMVEGLRTYPEEAYFSGHSHLQGGLSHSGTYWLSSSKPTQGRGVLYRTGPNKATSNLSWNDSPEDMAYDAINDAVWSLSEGINARYVFRSSRGSID